MEFVLMTTTSTPDTSRSGSVMKFGDYREDESGSETSALQIDEEFIAYSSDSDDEDKTLLDGFNLMTTRQRLGSYDFCTRIVFDAEQQRGLKLEIGVHVSEENPWKQIRKEILLDYLPEDENAPKDILEFRSKLFELRDDDYILVGYAAPIADVVDKNTFLLYADIDSANDAISLIRVLEAFERQRTKKKIYKQPRFWKSQGSEKEIDLLAEKKRKDKLEVEIQRFCSANAIPKPLQFRFAEDVRDGYVELIPKAEDRNVIVRRRISVAVQSAAQRVECEQQTDPTFPANAWTQYFYELPHDPEAAKENVEAVETEAKKPVEDQKNETKDENEFIGPSEAMKTLLKTLEFNAVDMYRNDYEFITSNKIKKYIMPVITEIDCFIEPSICLDRFVNAFAWHPTYSGVFVASYTYKTLNTQIKDEKIQNEAMIQNLVVSSSPVLLWSFNDNLYPKLVLDSPREVTYLSFCPYDVNVLLGSLITGQFVIWDLKDRLLQVENPEVLTENQEKNRKRMNSLIKWSKLLTNQPQNIVPIAAITPKESSHLKKITSIKWLNRKHSIASTGLVQESKPNEIFRHFVTASIDGSISFWDLDFINPNEAKKVDLKRKSIVFESDSQYVSPYRKLSEVIQPIYTIACGLSVTNLIFDDGHFRYESKKSTPAINIKERTEHSVTYEVQEKPNNRLTVSSLMGTIETFIWEGFLCKEGKPETIKQTESFQSIHNGPVLQIERNPFISDVFLSIGQKIVAVWCENNQQAPILWRRRESNITCCQWSSSKLSLFFLARQDGFIELWDLLTRTDDPCILHDSGRLIITIITQHKLPLPIDVLLVGDQKANLRVFTMPLSISRSKPDDFKKFREFIDRKLRNKEKFNKWQDKYTEANADLREPKQLLREESRKTIEQLEREKEDNRQSAEKRSKSPTKKKSKVYDLPERLHHKWETMNIKRLMKVLLELKHFDPEMIAMHIKPERDRLAYNERKKRAIEENFHKIHHEVSELRARLIPPQDINQEAERWKYITGNMENMFTSNLDGFQYEQVERDFGGQIVGLQNSITEVKWHDILERAHERRSRLNKAIFARKRAEYIRKMIDCEEKAEKS